MAQDEPRTQSDRDDTPEEGDRVVSRRVDNPTRAGSGDGEAYRAAERADRDPGSDGGSEPTRSE